MSRTSFIVGLMCLGFCQVHSVHLTREIILPPQAGLSPQAAEFSKVLGDFLKPTQTLVTSLATVLSSSPKPQVSDVLNTVNSGLGAKILVIDDDVVRLDAQEFETALIRSAREASKMLYPHDYFKQLSTYALMERKVKDMSGQIVGAFSVAKVPLKQFEEVLGRGHSLSKRDIQKRDIISDLLNTLLSTARSAICNTVINQIQAVVNETLTGLITDLGGIQIDSSGDLLSSLLSSGVEVIVFLLEQGINFTNQFLQSEGNNICVALLNSTNETTTTTTTTTTTESSGARKRREVSELVPQSLGLERDLDIFSAILDPVGTILWGLISTLLNPLLKLAVSSAFSLLQNLVYGAIDSIFTPLFTF